MTTRTRCVHDDDPLLCPPCQRGDEPYRPERDTAPSGVFEARYDGPCAGCDVPIVVGDRIVATTVERDGELVRRRYWHAEHAEEL